MTISSRTPEGSWNECPVCRQISCIEPSLETADATCPFCGNLFWFPGEGIVVARVYQNVSDALDAIPCELRFDHRIPRHIVELVPESVARENRVIPLYESRNTLVIAWSDPLDTEVLERIRFILDRGIAFVYTKGEWIDSKIDECYST